MNRTHFLTVSSLIAIIVGAIATLSPEGLLASKGVEPVASTICWLRQVGVAMIGIGAVAFQLRRHAWSPTMRAVLLGNALHQVLLGPIEVVAYLQGTITKLGGIVPNTVLHVLLATGFLYFATGRGEPKVTTAAR